MIRVVLLFCVMTLPLPAKAEYVPSVITCDLVRYAIAKYGYAAVEDYAHRFLTADQISKAKLCLKRAKGGRT